MQEAQMSVSLIIPNYNGEELLAKNLPSVIKAKENKNNKIEEIIVVDDCSTDGSVELIKNNFKEIKIVRHKINRGFSAAINTGVRSAKGTLLALINTDVIPSADFLEPVLRAFKDEGVFAVSFNEEGYSWAKGLFKNGFVEHFPGKLSPERHQTFWVSGGSGIFRRDLWIKFGGMDEKVFSPFYWEDIDLSYRALKRGYSVYWEPKSKVIHKHESTVSKLSQKCTQRIKERNQLLFIWKNITSRRLFNKHVVGLGKRVAKHPGYLRIVIMSLLHLKPVIKARRKEIKESKVCDEAIFQSFASDQ